MFKKVVETLSKEEEWIWVEGFKGTDKDMKCNGYQYELGKQHDMPEDAKIELCRNGFHLCEELHHVFEYYPIGYGNRFFKVKALVRKKDLESVEYNFHVPYGTNKLTSKSIVFERELEPDEIITDAILRDSKVPNSWTYEKKVEALKRTPRIVEQEIKSDILTELGYSREFSNYIVATNRFIIARALGTQKDISMDTRVNRILEHIDEETKRSI